MFMEDEKKTKSSVFIIAVSLFCVMVIGYFALTSGGSSVDTGTDTDVNRMQTLTHEVRGMEADVKKKEGEMVELVDGYEAQTGNKPSEGFIAMDLNEEERELLEEQIGKEKDVSARSLLQEILRKRDQISDLKDKIANIEDRLPAPHITQKGENHYGIALAFLLDEKGVEEEEAKKILSRTALFEELAEGFKVWNFYTGDEYGTSVTQGDAAVSPNFFVHRAKKKLIDARDAAIFEGHKMAENLKTLGEEQEHVITQLGQVSKEKEDLVVRVMDLNRRVNSMSYRLDSRKNLKKKGILKSGFLSSGKLQDISPGHFDRSLDLNLDDQVVISAAALGIGKIKDVVLYPRFYKKGSSYKVFIAPNKKHALLTLKDKNKFKSERVIIAVK
ncbi:MAG: hypothetical protein GY940_16375 [bacterium]|nr:hypothetical protein [bacterium]